MSMDKGKEVNVTSSIITSQQIGHNNYHTAGSRQGLQQSRHENSQQQSQQQFIRPAVYTQQHLRQSGGYQPGIVNDMKPAFPQQSGLAVQAPGQQGGTSTMMYPGQHVSNRPPLNPGASSGQMPQPHGGQTYYPRPSGNSGAGGQGGGQGGNQGQQRYVQPSQRGGGMNMPIAMIQTPQSGPSNSQANYFASSHQMFVQPPLGQTHVIYQQHGPPHHPTLSEAVEFPSHPDVLSVPMIPSHSSSARYTTNHSQENGDMGSPAMSYRFPSPQYQYQALYVPQTSGQYGNQCVFPPQMMMHQSNPRSGVPVNPCMMAPMTNQPTQPPAPNRKKNFIQIVDPKTQLDITMDIVNNAGNNPTPPASGTSSVCGTPPSSVATPPPAQYSVAAAQFARQVAAVAVSSASTSGQPPAPPIESVATQSQSSATVASSSSATVPPTAPAALATPTPPVTVTNLGRTKGDKDFNGNQPPHANVSVAPAEKPVNIVSNDAPDGASSSSHVAIGVSKEPKVAVKVEDEVPPPVVVKAVEKPEPAQPQQPHITTAAAAHPTPYVNLAPSTRAGVEPRETAPLPPPPVALVKKPDSAPPPPFPVSKNANASSEVNASVAPFSSLNPSVTEKMTGPPGSSQVIISAPPDHPPSRESAVEHGPLTHHHSQVVVMPAKSASPVVPAPFTQQQGPGQQPGSARPPPAGQGVETGRLPPGHHHPPVTPSPFGTAQPQVQTQIHKQQNGEVQPEAPKIAPAEIEGPTKDGKQQQQQQQQHAPPTSTTHNAKKNRDVKSRSEPKEINSVAEVVVEDRIVAPTITTTTTNAVVPDTPAEVQQQVTTTVDTSPTTPAETEDTTRVISSPASEEEGKSTEEMLDKEAKRKVAEKNEENSKVSNMALDKLEKDARVINDSVPSNKLPLNLNKLPYKEDQWSPFNLDGKKQYDRDFLLKMQNQPPSLKKPEGLPDLEVIRDDIVNTLIIDRMPPTNVNKSRGQVANDFTPQYVQNKPQPGRRVSQQGGRNKEQPQQPPKKVVSISLCQEVKLRDSEDPWKPSYKQSKAVVEDDPIEKLNKRVRALLNKLTPQNFQSLMGQVDTFGIDTEEKLVGVIDLVFEKAINEPNFSVAYANMCKSLSAMKVQSPNSDGVNFRKLIIGRCQTEFEKDANEEIQQRDERQKMIDEADPEKKKVIQEELEEGITRSRRRSLGNIRFIGELYKLKMLTGKIMHECVKKLLSENDEDSLECLCRLLSTIGKDLEFPPQTVNPMKPPQGPPKPPQPDNRVADYFQTMGQIVNKRQTTSRVRFMLLDVIDLRLQGWVPRRDENNPKTIDQIHREAEAEHQEKQLLYQTPIVKRNDDRMDRRGGPGMGGKRGSNENEGWTSVGSGRKTPMTPMPDTSKCRMRMENLDENNIQLGPQTSGWSKGSMGGGRSSHEGDRAPSNQGMNRYSLLTDHQAEGRRGPPPRQQQQSHSMSGRDGRNMGGSMSQQLPMSNHRSGGGGGGGGPYRGSISREHEQAIANVKNIANNNNDGAGRPHSLPTLQKPPPSASSRSSSASRESDRESQVKECDTEQLETKIKSTIEEFFSVGDLAEAVLSVTEEVPSTQMPYFVTYIVNQFLEKSSKARIQIGQLLCELVKKNKLSVDQFWKGMTEIFESAEELAIDIPKFWEYLAEIISPLYVGEILNLSSFKQSVESLLGANQTSVLLANLLKVMSNLSPNGVHNLWRESGLRISQFVPVDEVDEFVNRHKLKFLQEEARPASVPFIRKDKIFEGLKHEIQTQICSPENNSETGKGLDKIYNWINQNVSEQQRKDPSFIRALVTAIADRSIKLKDHGAYEIIQPVFDSCWTVIKRYVDNRDELELETLFALQNFVHRLEHPQGLLSHFFHSLYDKEVISDEGFLAWRACEGQEVEGHAVAVKAVNTFLISIKQYEEEDESA